MILVHCKKHDPKKLAYQADKFCFALLDMAEDLIASGQAQQVRESLETGARRSRSAQSSVKAPLKTPVNL